MQGLPKRTPKIDVPDIIRQLEKEVVDKANSGKYEFNVYTGFKPIDPKCPRCGTDRQLKNAKYFCRNCD